MEGWIKLHRKLKSHWLWQEPEKLKWWLDVLIEANHEDKKVFLKGTLVECKRGQCVKSLDTWAKEWRTTKKTVRHFFTLLEKDGMINIFSVTVSTRLTVCNYENYQESGTPTTTQSKRRVNAEDTQTTPKQEGKELKELKKEYRPHVRLLESEHRTLLDKYGAEPLAWMLDKLEGYKSAKGATYKSDHGAINKWVVGAWKESGGVEGTDKCPLGNTIDRTLYPGWPKDKPYTQSNITRFNNQWPLRADNT